MNTFICMTKSKGSQQDELLHDITATKNALLNYKLKQLENVTFVRNAVTGFFDAMLQCTLGWSLYNCTVTLNTRAQSCVIHY